jgi:hypothetical protein
LDGQYEIRQGKEKMRATEFISEAPLADFQPPGDFTKPGPFRGVDKKLVPHAATKMKAAKFFEKTPYDFRLFFSNLPGTGKYSESGAASPVVIQEYLLGLQTW